MASNGIKARSDVGLRRGPRLASMGGYDLYVWRMGDFLHELEVFLRTAERASFSHAARELGLSQPSVSRTIATLEERLGVSLVLRNTRQITLTEAGLVLVDRARQLLADAADTEEAVRGTGELAGLLRVAATHGFGSRELVPLLPEFLLSHPKVRIELLLSDENQDLVANRIDVAFRVGRLSDSTLKARRVGTAFRHTVASPEYLKRRGTPKSPAELIKHDCICGPGATGPAAWSYRRKGRATAVAIEGRVTVSSAASLVACTTQGLGITIVATWMCRAELDSGALVTVLKDYLLEPIDIHALFPDGRIPSNKARALAQHVLARLPVEGLD